MPTVLVQRDAKGKQQATGFVKKKGEKSPSILSLLYNQNMTVTSKRRGSKATSGAHRRKSDPAETEPTDDGMEEDERMEEDEPVEGVEENLNETDEPPCCDEGDKEQVAEQDEANGTGDTASKGK